MKKLFILVAIATMCVFNCNAQEFKVEGKTYISVSKSKEGKDTGYTWRDSKGKEYKIYVRENGHCYVNKMSTKTGKTYKYSLGEIISKDICQKLNIKYIPNKTK